MQEQSAARVARVSKSMRSQSQAASISRLDASSASVPRNRRTSGNGRVPTATSTRSASTPGSGTWWISGDISRGSTTTSLGRPQMGQRSWRASHRKRLVLAGRTEFDGSSLAPVKAVRVWHHPRRGSKPRPTHPQSARPRMRLRSRLLVQTNCSGSGGQVVVPGTVFRAAPQEPRVNRVETRAG